MKSDMHSNVVIRAITSQLASGRLSNDELADRFEGWTAEKIFAKTGIRQRAVAAEDECASDLAVSAACQLFAAGKCRPDEIDILILCTQSPDYLLPATACLIQNRLNLPTSCMAFDLNQGCSGYIHGLAVATALLRIGVGRRALLLTGDTYSKYLDPADRSVVTIFGDAATATLLEGDGEAGEAPAIGPFVFGTDGSGAQNLVLARNGCRIGFAEPDGLAKGNGHPGNQRSLYMNGPKIFEFALRTVPRLVESTLQAACLAAEQIDLYVFHQANRFLLDTLRRKLGIPMERFVMEMEETGNTVSSTIPIALQRCLAAHRMEEGTRVMLVGFGVGYSWGAAVVRM